MQTHPATHLKKKRKKGGGCGGGGGGKAADSRNKNECSVEFVKTWKLNCLVTLKWAMVTRVDVILYGIYVTETTVTANDRNKNQTHKRS